MTTDELKAEDQRFTILLRKAEKKAREAQIKVNRVRVEFAKQWWGLEIGSLVTNTNAFHVHRGAVYCVTRIDARHTATYGKKPCKPWVNGRRILDDETSENTDTNLLSNWEPYDS